MSVFLMSTGIHFYDRVVAVFRIFSLFSLLLFFCFLFICFFGGVGGCLCVCVRVCVVGSGMGTQTRSHLYFNLLNWVCLTDHAIYAFVSL